MKVVLEGVAAQPDAIAETIGRQLEWLGIRAAPSETWAVKLNLTYPRYLPGVVNSPVFVEGLCRWARENTVRLNFIKGDGGNGAYSAQDAFVGNGVSELAARYEHANHRDRLDAGEPVGTARLSAQAPGQAARPGRDGVGTGEVIVDGARNPELVPDIVGYIFGAGRCFTEP